MSCHRTVVNSTGRLTIHTIVFGVDEVANVLLQPWNQQYEDEQSDTTHLLSTFNLLQHAPRSGGIPCQFKPHTPYTQLIRDNP